MNAPRHLWSGDWRQDSSAHAEALAARRARREEAAEPENVAPARRPVVSRPPRVVSRPPRRPLVSREATRTLRERLRSLRLGDRGRLRAAGLVVSLTLLSAGGAYVVTSLVVRVVGGS